MRSIAELIRKKQAQEAENEAVKLRLGQEEKRIAEEREGRLKSKIKQVLDQSGILSQFQEIARSLLQGQKHAIVTEYDISTTVDMGFADVTLAWGTFDVENNKIIPRLLGLFYHPYLDINYIKASLLYRKQHHIGLEFDVIDITVGEKSFRFNSSTSLESGLSRISSAIADHYLHPIHEQRGMSW